MGPVHVVLSARAEVIRRETALQRIPLTLVRCGSEVGLRTGLTHNAHAVEARPGRVLDVLMRFLGEELLPLLNGPEREAAARDMVPVIEGVRNISSYIKRRLDRLRGGELRGLENLTIRCPDCQQMTLVAEPAPADPCCRGVQPVWPGRPGGWQG